MRLLEIFGFQGMSFAGSRAAAVDHFAEEQESDVGGQLYAIQIGNLEIRPGLQVCRGGGPSHAMMTWDDMSVGAI